MLEPEMKAKIDKLWNMFWSGGLSNPLTAIEQMSYLIFMKRLEDLDNLNRMRAEARREKQKSIFAGHDDCRWSNWKHMNAEAMYKHVSEVVFPFIKNLHDGEEVLYSRYMRDATFMIPKASLVQEAVSIIDEIEIGERPDIQGDIYEHLLGELKTSGKNGQFRTPRHIIRMMVELVDPDIGQKICDPACGTGGFLIAAYQHILRKYTTPDMVKEDPDGTPHNLIGNKIVKKEHWKLLWNETFYGYDFEVTMIRIALMNMILHGITRPNIEQKDTLSKQFTQRPVYDVILANPPFAGYVDKGDINDAFSLDTTKTELLFVELFHNLLSVGGKTAKVWFYDMNADGYSLDDKRDFIDGKGDIPDVVGKFKAGRVESDKSILVPFEVIKKNGFDLSVSTYRKIEYEQTDFEDPEVLIQNLSRLEADIAKDLKGLQGLI